MDERIRKEVAYLHANLGATLTLDGLSRTVHLSPSRFAHLFRQGTGLAPLAYVGLQRIGRARTPLERTSLSVAEVAAEVGMEPFHFPTRFKAQTGGSPPNPSDPMYRGSSV